ncbi:MAG: hypothetical protein ABI609_13020 [Acidobacteriota bacterium]
MRRFGLLCSALLLTVALPGLARGTSSSALGADGSVYSISTGTMKQLFPRQVNAYNQSYSVLALDINRPGQAPVRQMVPDTDGAETESAPYVLVDETGTVFLLWQTRFNINTLLYLRSLQDGQWSAPILIFGNSFAVKSSPQIVLTQDRFSVDDGLGGSTAIKRTVLHLIWWEDAEGGRVLYAPLVLINGLYQDLDQPLFTLNDLDSTEASPDPRIAETLYESPRVLSGQSDHSVVIGFTNSRNGHVATVEALLVPGDLGTLAEAERAHIITGGRNWQGNLGGLGDDVRAHIITGGRGGRLSANVLSFLGDQVRAHIITSGLPASDNELLASDIRNFLVRAGAGLMQAGLSASGGNSATLLTLAQASSTSTSPTAPAQSVQLRLVSSRPAPITGSGPTSMFLSSDGARVTTAWDDTAGNVLYCESTDQGWTEPVSLVLSDTLTHSAAYRLLSERLRGH